MTGVRVVSSVKPLPRGNTLATGGVVVVWGLLFRVFQDYADLGPLPTRLMTGLSVACYLFGLVIALQGLSELTSNPVIKAIFQSLGLLGISFLCHLTGLWFDQAALVLSLKVMVLVGAMSATAVLVMSIPQVYGDRVSPSMSSKRRTNSDAITLDQKAGTASDRRGTIANFVIIILGLLAGFIELANALLTR
jgi:hypothetical protein